MIELERKENEEVNRKKPYSFKYMNTFKGIGDRSLFHFTFKGFPLICYSCISNIFISL